MVVHSDADSAEENVSHRMNRDPMNFNNRWKRGRRVSDRRRSRITRRLRYRKSWRSARIRSAVIRPTKPVPLPSFGPEICQNRSKVSQIQDESGPVVCLRRSFQELLRQLESVGGFVKKYVAVNQSEACGFEDLTAFPEDELIINKTGTTRIPKATARAIRKPRAKRQFDGEKSETTLQRQERSIPTSPGTVIRGCQGRGTIVDDTNLHRLCTECAATTRLGDDRFPNYINEVICHDKDHQCAAKMGLCLQKTLKLSFLRFDGKFERDAHLSGMAGKPVYKEVWAQYTQEIRSCCECEMYPFIYHLIASRTDGDDGSSDDEQDYDNGET